MIKKLSAMILLLLLFATLTACELKPSPTAVPPTKPTEPTRTPTPLPNLPLSQEPYRSSEGGFALRYPEGWQNLGFGGLVMFFSDSRVIESDTPTDTLIIIEGGPLAGISILEADFSGAKDSREMIQRAAAELASGDSTLRAGEVEDIQVGGEEGAAADLSGKDTGARLAGRVVCVCLGENGLTIIAAGPADRWNEFIPTFEAMLASAAFFPPEVPTGVPQPTMVPTPTEVPEPTPGPAPTLVGGPPEGFLWRVGGESGFDATQFGSLRGMDIGPDGNLYVADTWQGITVLTPDGTEVTRFESELSGASDVKFGPNGNLYVAAWGANAVYIFTPAGEQVGMFGELGMDDGEFSDFSPEFLAVCPDGRVYAADEGQDENGNNYERVEVFDAQGTYLAQWSLTNIISQTTTFFNVSGMDCGADGKVYLTGYFGDYVMVLDGEGNHVADLGKEPLFMAGAHGVSVDSSGDLYVGTWNGRVIVLDAGGQQIGKWGIGFDGEGNLAEGQVYDVYGIVADDYGNVYFSDYTGTYTYLTKFKFSKG